MTESNVENLDLQALQDRNRLHQSVTELKSQVTQVRDKLDPATNARQHFLTFSIVAALIGLLSGYRFGGAFTR